MLILSAVIPLTTANKNMRKRLSDLARVRNLFLLIVYAGISIVSLAVSYLLRFDFNIEAILSNNLNVIAPTISITLVSLVSLALFGQFKIFLGCFYMRDLLALMRAYIFSYAVAFVLMGLFDALAMSRGVFLMSFVISLALAISFRLSFRILRERTLVTPSATMRTPVHVAVFGAGNLGTSLVADLQAKRHLGVLPVVLFDDDKDKIGTKISGVVVEKIPESFDEARRRWRFDRAIIATSKFPSHRLTEITLGLKKIGIEPMMQPSYFDLASGRIKLAPMRKVNILDVLGRPQADMQDELVENSLAGKVVMVTGAGGSIGSELCRQIAMCKVSTLILVERCEVQLFKIQQDLLSRKYGITLRACVADVCDRARMNHLISLGRPDIIFHAAAHKHVPMMESQPGEALKNNVYGTWVVADLASRNNVEKFLLISTDKAVNPTNVMGASKRFAELVVQSMQNRKGNTTKFVAVRFGNVLGSSGSVILTFQKQIEAGGPLTLTHPDVTRYFMTIPEAVGLVLKCGEYATGGEILVLDMGEPVKIMDLAKKMIVLNGLEPDVDIKIDIIGLRPGEKLYEELQNKDERLVRTSLDKVFCFSCQPEKYEDVYKYVEKIKEIADSKDVNDLKRFLNEVVPEYRIQYYD